MKLLRNEVTTRYFIEVECEVVANTISLKLRRSIQTLFRPEALDWPLSLSATSMTEAQGMMSCVRLLIRMAAHRLAKDQVHAMEFNILKSKESHLTVRWAARLAVRMPSLELSA